MAKDYNQALLDRGYTQEQIDSMRSKAAEWWTNQEIVKAGWTPTVAKQETVAETPTTPTTNNVDTPTVVKEETKVENVVETPEIKQEWALKPLNQDYYNQTSTDSQEQIVRNLNNYKQSNPEYFSDYESFKKNFSYNARNDEQKNTLDTWYNWYQKGLSLSSIPTTDLYTQYQNGEISNADLEILRSSNPTKYAELQNQINKGNIISAYDDDKQTETFNFQDASYQVLQQMFTNYLSWWDSGVSNIFSEYKDKMESPEMLGLSDQATEYENQIEQIQDDIATMTKAVEKEYEGTWASRAKISAIVADRTYELQLQLRTANSNYNKVATQYNNRLQQYQNEFSMQVQEYQLNMQARNQQMQELGFAMDLMSFETPQQKQDREWDYRVKQQEYTNGNINSKDYQTRYKAALNSVQNLLSQYEWIPMVRSAEEMADDILKAIDNGSTLGEELSKINQQIQKKPEYKYLYNNTFSNGKSNSRETIKLGNSEYIVWNWELYTADEFNKMFSWNGTALGNAKAYDVVDESALANDLRAWVTNNLGKFLIQSKNLKWNKGWQCWKFVNDYLQYIGMTDASNRYYDNKLSTKLNSINSYSPKVGTVAVFDYWYNNPETWENYGHVGIVTKVYEDGSFDIRDSNRWSDEKIDTRHVTEWDKDWNALQGFFDPSKPAIDRSSATLSESSNMTVGNLTSSQFDNYVKQYINWETSYSEIKSSYGDEGLAKVTERAQQLIENWYQKSMKITDPDKILAAEKDYLTKFNSMNKETKEAIQWTDKMNTALAAIDADKRNDKKTLNWASQVIVNAFNKLMDPNSVIRESEYARTPEGQSLINQMEWKIEQIKSGWAWLTYANLKGLVDLANQLSAWYQQQQNELALLIKNNADTYGLNINNILPISVIESLNNPNWDTSWVVYYESSDTTRKPKWYDSLKNNNSGSNSFINIDWYEFNSNW